MGKVKLTEEQERLFANCKWCNGGRTEDGHLPCPDCEGTGMQGGKLGEKKFDELVEEMARKHKEES